MIVAEEREVESDGAGLTRAPTSDGELSGISFGGSDGIPEGDAGISVEHLSADSENEISFFEETLRWGASGDFGDVNLSRVGGS